VPAQWQSRILHAALVGSDLELLGSDAFPGAYEKPQGFCLTLGLSDLVRAREVFSMLSEGGVVKMPLQQTFWSPGFGVVVDQFGITWELNRAAAGEPDGALRPT